MSGLPRPVTTAREWAARAGIIPWYAAAASGFVQRGLKALYTMELETRNLVLYSEDVNKNAKGVARDWRIDDEGNYVHIVTLDPASEVWSHQTVRFDTAMPPLSQNTDYWAACEVRVVSGDAVVQARPEIADRIAPAYAPVGGEWTELTVAKNSGNSTATTKHLDIEFTALTQPTVVEVRRVRAGLGLTVLPYTPTTDKQAVYDYSGNVNDAYLGSVGSAHINPVSKALWLPGTSGNYASTPSPAIIGDIDIRAEVTWRQTGATVALVSKYNWNGNNRSVRLTAHPDGRLRLQWSPDGTSTSALVADSSVALVPDQKMWVRATLDIDNGAGGHTTRFYTSPDGETWTQIPGQSSGGPGTTQVYSGTEPLYIGTTSNLEYWMTGVVHRAQVWNGIEEEGGTLAVDFNPADAPGDVSQFYSSTTGELWTIHQATASDTNDPTWTGEGIVFDGVDDSLGGLPTATESFAVEDGAYTESPSDYGSAGGFGGTLRAHGRYDATLSDGERARNERAAKRYES